MLYLLSDMLIVRIQTKIGVLPSLNIFRKMQNAGNQVVVIQLKCKVMILAGCKRL